VVPQDPFLFSGTIEDNIRFGRPEASHVQTDEGFMDTGGSFAALLPLHG